MLFRSLGYDEESIKHYIAKVDYSETVSDAMKNVTISMDDFSKVIYFILKMLSPRTEYSAYTKIKTTVEKLGINPVLETCIGVLRGDQNIIATCKKEGLL